MVLQMTAERMVFRSVYVDHSVDAALKAQAAEDGVAKGEMFRRYLMRGMRLKRAATLRLEAGVSLSVRTVYLPVEVDEELRARAFALRTTKSDLIRKYLAAGMKAFQASAARKASRSTAAQRGRP